MHRRSFLERVAAAAGTALLGQRASAVEPASPWKTAVGLNGFMSSAQDYQKSYPIREVLDFARRTGFDGVELVDGWPEGPYPQADQTQKIDALRRLYDEFGLTVFSLQLGAGDAFHPDRIVRRQWLDQTRDRARFAQRVGCQCLGMWPGGPLRDQTIEQAIEHLADSFWEVGKLAADLGLLAAFEIEPPFVFNTEAHLRRILAAVDHPHLKTIYDPSHFDLMNGSTGKPHEMLQRIGVQNIGYVHLTDTDGTLRGGTSKHLPCGDGHAQIPTSLDTLLSGGFTGWIMIDGWKIPDTYAACRKGKLAIDAAIARHTNRNR